VGRFSERQMLWATIAVSAVLAVAFGALFWLDYRKVNAADLDSDPNAAEVTDPEQWGELRKKAEIQRRMQAAEAEARLIQKREQDVIVYREILSRDSAILPDNDDVNRLADTVQDFVNQSGVYLKQVSDLQVKPSGQAISRMPIKLQISGTFDQFLKFVNLFETHDRMVNVQSFTISAARGRGDVVQMHDIALDLETYVYTPTAGLASKPVDIAHYERRKEDPVVQKLVRQQKVAFVEKYQLKPRINRRDPLTDPRRERTTAAEAGADAVQYEDQKQIVDSLKFEVQTLRGNVQLEQEYLAERKYVAFTVLKPIIDSTVARLRLDVEQADRKVTIPELRDVFNEEVLAEFQKLADRGDVGPVVVGRADVAKFLEDMRAALEERDYEKVVLFHKRFQDWVQGRQLAEDTTPLVSDMRRLFQEASVMLDFLKLDLPVSGRILQPGGRSVVLLGGRPRKVGDFVDPAARCKLLEIHADRLLFEFDGYQIEKLDNDK
jgi:Tfp pilus assembly protein PilO